MPPCHDSSPTCRPDKAVPYRITVSIRTQDLYELISVATARRRMFAGPHPPPPILYQYDATSRPAPSCRRRPAAAAAADSITSLAALNLLGGAFSSSNRQVGGLPSRLPPRQWSEGRTRLPYSCSESLARAAKAQGRSRTSSGAPGPHANPASPGDKFRDCCRKRRERKRGKEGYQLYIDTARKRL